MPATFRKPSPASTPTVSRRQRSALPGQTFVLFAFASFVLVGFMALAVDGGFILAERRQVQSAADAGALAAAGSLSMNRTAQITPAGEFYGGALNGGDGATASVNWPPSSGPYAGNGDYVEVIVTKPVQRFFLGAIYNGPWQVTARAVAGVEPEPRAYALLALNGCSGTGNSIYINGSGSINVHQGSIMSNCHIARSGQSSVVTAGGTIDAAGTVDAGSLWNAGQGIWNNRRPVSDPIVTNGILPPQRSDAQNVRTVTTAAQLQSAVTNLNASGRCPNGSTCVMQPGYYGGNLSIEVQGTLEMQPGIYYFGDSFTITTISSSATIRGTNVLLYVTDSARFDPANAAIRLSANATSLYTGGLDGMVMWIANCTPFLMQSNGTFILDGVIYAPCSLVRLYGSPGSNGIQVIVGQLELAGSGSFDILYREYIRTDSPRAWLVE